MTRQYSIAEARNQLPSIVHDAEQGETVEITRRGRPVAVLLSVPEFKRLTTPRPDFWELIVQLRARGDFAGAEPDDVFEDVRDRSVGRDSEW